MSASTHNVEVMRVSPSRICWSSCALSSGSGSIVEALVRSTTRVYRTVGTPSTTSSAASETRVASA
ncbi:hypothetical protein ACFQV8_08405 [Pseudonocardia benzenivorans]